MPENNFVFNSVSSALSQENFFTVSEKEGVITFEVESGNELSIVLEINEPHKFFFHVKRDTVLHLGLIGDHTIKDLKINGIIDENSEIYLYFADFSSEKNDFSWEFELAGKNAKGVFKVASLSSGKDSKRFDILVNHTGSGTYGLTDCYGVAKDDSFLSFYGNGHIYKGRTESRSVQNCRIMVFDENSHGVVKPVLQIDDNDIEASHSAILGKINPDQMFYMTSRGLTEQMAKELITYGYLRPILNGFSDEESQNKIQSLIEEKMA
ncbi:MAG: SufD family Fe-S cluster assembly protein [Coprobacillus sp.]|nr:SufD family Fe-S cluster assembly protein [Coprobacillus sp.]